jgi:ABC-type sugar transport system ATPase subunit
MSAEEALAVHGVWRHYPGVVALSDVSLRVGRGETVGLVGHNGAGKSTLTRILSGVERPDEGTVSVAGEPVSFSSPDSAIAHGIAIVPQHLNVVPNLTVEENMILGFKAADARDMVGGGRLRSPARLLRPKVRTVAAQLGLEDQLRRPAGLTRPSTQRMVMIARALLRSPSVVLLDEPSAALHAAEVELMFAAVERLRSDGMGIVFISHRLEEVLTHTSRVVVMRQGKVVDGLPTAGLDKGRLGALIAGHELDAPPVARATRDQPVVLACDGLAKLPRVRDVSFGVHSGEILGLAGLNGSGRSTVLRTIAGLEAPDAGTITVDGKPFRRATRRAAIKAGVAYLPDDRAHNGVVPEMTVAAAVTLANDQRFRVARFIPLLRGRREIAEVDRVLAELDAHPRDAARRKMKELSGGNQQKALMARALLSEARVYVFDEPTEGVDVAARAELHNQIRKLAARGAAVVVASSEIDEIVTLASRVLVVSDGRVVREFEGAEISEVAVTRACVTG